MSNLPKPVSAMDTASKFDTFPADSPVTYAEALAGQTVVVTADDLIKWHRALESDDPDELVAARSEIESILDGIIC